MQAFSSPASAAICAFFSAVMASARPPADVLMSPTREVSSTVPLGIVALLSAVVVLESVVVVPELLVSGVARKSLLWAGVLRPGVRVGVLVLLAAPAAVPGGGCCTRGSVAPMFVLASLSVFAVWSAGGLAVVPVLVSAEALGLGCCTAGS